ncbi:MAG: RNA polymerase sigma-54 factor, partial [Mariprofundaceae bacterium]
LCLLDRQKNYLLYGPLGLKPLTLMDVANDIGMHESTVCRAISGKYAKTPIGIVELKSFFSAGLATRNGGMISVRKVQEYVRMFISTEPPHKPISDQAIADRLAMQGVVVARRTVAKYREAMGILPTSKRRCRKH